MEGDAQHAGDVALGILPSSCHVQALSMYITSRVGAHASLKNSTRRSASMISHPTLMKINRVRAVA